MIKLYEWKVLTSDGLLKEPDEIGPHYAAESLNGHGFESEEEAVSVLEKKTKRHGHDIPSELVLIVTYQPHQEGE